MVGVDKDGVLLFSGQQSSCEEKTTTAYLKFVVVVDLYVAAAPITLQTKPGEVGREADTGLLLSQWPTRIFKTDEAAAVAVD